MGYEVLPTGSDPVSKRTTRLTTIESGRSESDTYSGPTAAIVALEAQIAAAGIIASGVASLEFSEQGNGRATLVAVKAPVRLGSEPADDGAIQELYGFDIVRDIRAAPYFSTLTDAQVIAVMTAFEAREAADAGWVALQLSLYKHLVHGQETFVDTAYEFRKTWVVESTKQLKAASANANTVQALPGLGATLRSLIDSLPSGEWLKKPTTVRSLGRSGWEVTITYQYSKKWSIIYGGTGP